MSAFRISIGRRQRTGFDRRAAQVLRLRRPGDERRPSRSRRSPISILSSIHATRRDIGSTGGRSPSRNPSPCRGRLRADVHHAWTDGRIISLEGHSPSRQTPRHLHRSDLIDLRQADRPAAKARDETGLAAFWIPAGEYVSGTVRQRLTLSSGRFAMIDDGLGFQLVPGPSSNASSVNVAGVARAGAASNGAIGRKRDLGI